MLPSASMHSRTLPAGRSAVPSSGFSTVAGRHPRGGGVQQGGLGRAGKEGRKEDGGGTGGGERKKDEKREVVSCRVRSGAGERAWDTGKWASSSSLGAYLQGGW